ncbi:39S ribosomal protein L47, mitochondrial-like isoform X2 [Stylophora pistillata]|uniref:39S ribosomal protein L47, mitochondrial-like isoform X2 n=1 Tax=Stylophora pistillata TaxID=50429 RepID=UPI000C03CEBC|nr:39S ribosomal protein L47, mitochondrial-like isoform X2 [Stylophora pistillata]
MAVVLHNLRCFAFRPPISTELHIRSCLRGLRTSPAVFGLEEFFPPEVFKKGELAKEKVHTGRKWRAGELRGKSNEDLHKLWYVLLKERNMLMTLKHEAKRQSYPMPSPTRTHKVQKSMAAIKQVLSERLPQTG